MATFSQVPPIEPGVSQTLARWRAARYSDIRYKLNLTLEKRSPVLKGTIEVRVKVATQSEPPESAGGRDAAKSEPGAAASGLLPPIILDWRKIKGSESLSSVSNVSINGKEVVLAETAPPANAGGSDLSRPSFEETNEHLIFREGVVTGENIIKLDFTSPILTSGSAVTRYIDKEDGAEYIYSLFVPSDASTAFPVFDQPDLKARFSLTIAGPTRWSVISNERSSCKNANETVPTVSVPEYIKTQIAEFRRIKKPSDGELKRYAECMSHFPENGWAYTSFPETKPISTYVFAFAAGPWEKVSMAGEKGGNLSGSEGAPNVTNAQTKGTLPTGRVSASNVYVRKSQAAKFKPHASEVFRLNREAVKYLEQYFDYKFPFPKYDLVLIPEFPFGGMEHAGATFLREDRVIFPTEPTKNDYVTRANLIFHEAAHQWFGDTVTMKWFDDLWLKEGFAEFMAYKTLEKVMPEYNAWKIFYERNKQAAYLTDSTKGTTPIYQEIKNLNSAKSAYGNIVYRKAPSFLKQAEFYIGPDKFQTAVRAFLKKHEFKNAEWTDLVKEFETASGKNLKYFAEDWVKRPGLFKIRLIFLTPEQAYLSNSSNYWLTVEERHSLQGGYESEMKLKLLLLFGDGTKRIGDFQPHSKPDGLPSLRHIGLNEIPVLAFPNYQDFGYGIFLLDDKSRDYVLKNIHNEKDDFLRTMMWGSLWDSVREAELAPKDYVELVIKNLSLNSSRKTENHPVGEAPTPLLRKEGSQNANASYQGGEQDESTIQTLLGRVSTAMTYYLSDAQRAELAPKIEAVLIDKMQTAPTLGQRITFYRAFLNIASTENGRNVLTSILKGEFGETGGNPRGSKGVNRVENKSAQGTLPTGRVSASDAKLPIKTKDRFDIVTKLLILNDPEAPKLLADLEKSETSDEAKRYAYAAKAGTATAGSKAKFWNDFVNNKEISESWIEAAFVPFNSVRHADLTLPYLEKALNELPNHKRNRKIFFVNGWLAAFIGGQKSEEALAIVNKFLADNPNLDRDLRLKILENVDVIERAVKIRNKFAR